MSRVPAFCSGISENLEMADSNLESAVLKPGRVKTLKTLKLILVAS